jgi:hypothetical protein
MNRPNGMKATPINAITVIAEYKLDGEIVIEVPCKDYENFASLPNALSYNGTVVGKTGWSSDTYRACYKQNTRLAYPIG